VSVRERCVEKRCAGARCWRSLLRCAVVVVVVDVANQVIDQLNRMKYSTETLFLIMGGTVERKR